ncbi:MAG: hypothetical protein RI897_711 [Verrucomicrobiota bacterium]|jgi:hypothetical protein
MPPLAKQAASRTRPRPSPRIAAAVATALLSLVYTQADTNPIPWQDHGHYRSAGLSPAPSDAIGFSLIPQTTSGIRFTNALSDDRATLNRNLLSGAGLAAGDVNGDELCDLYFCGLDSDNKLFLNIGNFQFREVTDQPILRCSNQDSTAAAFADIDGDNDLDLLVNSLGHGTRIFSNDGNGHFEETTAANGVASNAASMSMALADIDGDEDLDLFVVNYRLTTILDRPSTQFKIQMIESRPVIVEVDGQPTTRPELTNRFELAFNGEVLEFGEPDSLYINDGKGHFSPASFTDGRFIDETGRALTSPPRDWGLSVRFHDFTGDGAPDLYVCNDLHPPDRIWVNNGTGRFRALPSLALRHLSSFSMGVDFGDLDRDGDVDLYSVDMVSREPRNRKIQVAGISPVFCPVGIIDTRPQYSQNTLQMNRGDGTFAEIAHYAGLEATEWSWHPVLVDVDLDGYEDLIIPNGMLRDFQNFDLGKHVESAVASRNTPTSELSRMFLDFESLHLPNLSFRNLGGFQFEETTEQWGFNTRGISQGLALADLDNDGDLDVACNNLNDAPGLFRNNASQPRIAIRLEGVGANTRGIGAVVRIRDPQLVQSQEIIAGGRYLSADQPTRTFAATSTNLSIEVTWRNGSHTLITNALPNQLYSIRQQPEEPHQTTPAHKPATPWFEDVSTLIRHRHHENAYQDFARQPLLPNMLSQLGPGISWTDLNLDGRDDLIIGTGQEGSVAALLNDGKGGFVPLNAPPFNTTMTRDTTTLLAWPQPGTTPSILAGSANYEDGAEQGSVALLLNPQSDSIEQPLPGQISSTGPMSLADIDADGDLDLFVGGRSVPGRYPEPSTSLLFTNHNGHLSLDSRCLGTLAHVGLVSGSAFSDIDNDNDPDLILACEWGPVRILRNTNGTFQDVTTELGLQAQSGWWNGVQTADLNGDGLQDIIASNWGLNTHYRASPEHPRRIYYGDFLENEVIQIIETIYDPQLGKEVPERSLSQLGLAMPTLPHEYPSHTAFAQVGISEMLGPLFDTAGKVEATTLPTTLFLNRGDHFEPHPLPKEAQLSPAMAVCIADFDGDGHEDVFLGQNFFTVQPFTMRNDAGRGLWLRGDGQGGLTPVSGEESGLQIYGDQRGAAVADYDLDGRVDLAVTQNGFETKLYRNTRAKPGLRVRLIGPPENPNAIGAVLRLVYPDQLGPAREIKAGAGYWSQDSHVQVLGFPSPPSFLQIRWPSGLVSQTPVRPGRSELTIRYPSRSQTGTRP